MADRVTNLNGNPIKLTDNKDGTFSINIQLAGNVIAEILTESDAFDNTLIFSDDIFSIEIYHDEDTPQTFIVNGITLVVASGGWRSFVGGTPSAEVIIPAGINCIIARLV